jgi:hypothetical protein
MCEALGEDFFVDLSVGEQLVRAKVREQQRPAERAQVKIAFRQDAVHVFDRQTGQRL